MRPLQPPGRVAQPAAGAAARSPIDPPPPDTAAPPQAAACCGAGAAPRHGPGYASPLDAKRRGPREALIYVPCITADGERPDYLATVDVDPASKTFGEVIHRLPTAVGDELHHSGWNSCSSAHCHPGCERRFLVLPALASGRVYAVDVKEPRTPSLHATVEPAAIAAGTGGLSFPHTSHCLPDGRVMVSLMGDRETGAGRGNWVLLDNTTFEVVGAWAGEDTPYGYDFWYQPRFNIMVSSEFGAPGEFLKGFDPAKAASHYGSKLHVWDWQTRKLRQTIDLGAEGAIPLEVRFAHDPAVPWGYVGCALSSNVVLLRAGAEEGAPLKTQVAIKQPWLKVAGWILPELPPLVTDILISLDDTRLFVSNWLRGDISCYDIANPDAPRLAGRVWLGGVVAASGGAVTIDVADLAALGLEGQPRQAVVKGVALQGGPQMIQLSLDGRRLYVTNSLLSPWDKQFYPGLVEKGSQLALVDVGEDGSLELNSDFIVDFGAEPGGPVLAHECRYPGGDSSSDIWV
ncbi:hypothetical protein Rsub_12189 [Raphidocelis subcapitata]|uniref:Methanethiol oxidase n=1 Tax=Raphidocelis subcapitata TaxID=307507 RepID=A0A2V0PIF0_9CHLO|nr:hypothetical protein Rsub_12189 [Raphidocelis subcapitata]|eukprot:GBF99564.1 hypothetical protein Rsub_12189 [Raphidocelis subcapitata]